MDFEFADYLADKLSKSNFGFAKTKEKITRAFSMKKQSNSTNLVVQSTNLSTSLYTPPRPPAHSSSRREHASVFKDTSMITPSPSNSRRLSRAFSSFMNIGSPLMLSRRQMSTTSLNVSVALLDGDDEVHL